MWCAAGVTLSGGCTKDGGSIIGSSVFYTDAVTTASDTSKDNLEKLNQELKVWKSCTCDVYKHVYRQPYAIAIEWIPVRLHTMFQCLKK